jgi:hypothetical protein
VVEPHEVVHVRVGDDRALDAEELPGGDVPELAEVHEDRPAFVEEVDQEPGIAAQLVEERGEEDGSQAASPAPGSR